MVELSGFCDSNGKFTVIVPDLDLGKYRVAVRQVKGSGLSQASESQDFEMLLVEEDTILMMNFVEGIGYARD